MTKHRILQTGLALCAAVILASGPVNAILTADMLDPQRDAHEFLVDPVLLDSNWQEWVRRGGGDYYTTLGELHMTHPASGGEMMLRYFTPAQPADLFVEMKLRIESLAYYQLELVGGRTIDRAAFTPGAIAYHADSRADGGGPASIGTDYIVQISIDAAKRGTFTVLDGDGNVLAEDSFAARVGARELDEIRFGPKATYAGVAGHVVIDRLVVSKA